VTDPHSVGVYVHIPFCERVCPYCDFAVEATHGSLSQEREVAYVDAVLRELEARTPAFAGRRLASLYFGGGTPSLLHPRSLARISAAVTSEFSSGGELEVTLEINPSTVERERLPAFGAEVGVNRLSIGVQSFDDSILKALGRAHRAQACHQTLAAARDAGFDNISVDLIFAALHQTPALLDRDLDAVADFAPEHVSSYELVMEERTPFGRAAREGKLQPYSEDAAADMIERIEQRLGAEGLRRYELTNYARSGYEAVHNRRYWVREPVLALGAGAHSTDPPNAAHPYGARRANPRGVTEYLAWVEWLGDGRGTGVEPSCTATYEALTREQAIAETIFLALRCSAGLSAAAFAAEFGHPPRESFAKSIDELVDRDLLMESTGGDLRLSRRGRMLADTVFTHFMG
jgi:oxygen-independent coproporphyrinogen-3 oxidase